jgi:hypothetical protein
VVCKTEFLSEVCRLLKSVGNAIEASIELVSGIEAWVDTGIFYDVYRPLLAGFYPHGILLQGVAQGNGAGKGGGSRSDGGEDAREGRGIRGGHAGGGAESSVDCAPVPWELSSEEEGLLVCPKGPSAGQSAVFMVCVCVCVCVCVVCVCLLDYIAS